MNTRPILSIWIMLLSLAWCGSIDAQNIQQADTARVVFFVH